LLQANLRELFRPSQIGQKLNIKYYALSFTNSHKDVLKFNKLLRNEKKIFKIETKEAIRNLKKIIKIAEIRHQFF